MRGGDGKITLRSVSEDQANAVGVSAMVLMDTLDRSREGDQESRIALTTQNAAKGTKKMFFISSVITLNWRFLL